jgi:glucokinase
MADVSRDTMVLAGDIGGTKTHLGLFAKGKKRPLLKVMNTYPSQEAVGLGDIVDQFLGEYGNSVDKACFGIAGPVRKGRVQTTNLAWEVSEVRLRRRFGWSEVRLINDLAATAQAIPLLEGKEVCSLNKARAEKGGTVGLVAPGTGLGMALLVCTGNGVIPVSSEGGHMDFGPNNREEVSLYQHLRERFGHVSAERVVSGPGLHYIYRWLKDSGRYKEPAWLKEKIKTSDPPVVVTAAALKKQAPIAVAALKMFVRVFGAVAGNLALLATTTGGLYLGGGIPPKILKALTDYGFLEAFENKGRFQEFLHHVPVRVVLNDKAALLGAAQCAFSRSL